MKNKFNLQNEYPEIWSSKPELIRNFLSQRDKYKQLCKEVAYILETCLKREKIEFSSISYRAKTLDSFVEKYIRKHHKDSLTEMTDLSGVRIVYLFPRDIKHIEKIIKREFMVIEKEDKSEYLGEDRFGYSGLHFLIKLGHSFSGTRYDDLRNLICEIQVRTILQDAWAIVNHRLVYKRESDIPSKLKRELNSLAGLFEAADGLFQKVHDERDNYLESIKSTKKNLLEQELNYDSLMTYVSEYFPKLLVTPSHISEIVSNLLLLGYYNVEDVHNAIKGTKEIAKRVKCKACAKYSCDQLSIALAFHDTRYRKTISPHLLQGVKLLKNVEPTKFVNNLSINNN